MPGDWFDYVGGTSTGAIIAGGVALGLPVARFGSSTGRTALHRVDGVAFVEETCEFGRAVSTRVDPGHFAGFFNDAF